jgi:amylosucrase
MPVLEYRRGENDGGYAVSDYRDVDPRFGSLGDLTRLSSALRRENMLLCLDVVLNHTADCHEWAKRALGGDREFQDFYYMYPDRTLPDEFEKTLPEVFPELAPGNFTWKAGISRWVMTVFNSFQWDLNYANPAVFVEMLRIILNLANLGVDVLRLDATPFLWKRLGTSSQNEPEAHVILQTLKACCRVVAPGTLFKSEAIVQPVEIIRYLGDAQTRECDIAYNASLMVYLWDALATKTARLLVRGLENIPPIPAGTTWITYVRCHDDIGLGFSDLDAQSVGYTPALHRRFLIDYYTGKFPGSPASGHPFMYNPRTGDARISGSCASLCGLEKARESGDPLLVELALKRILLLYGLVFSFGGIPLVYYGDELALCNDRSYEAEPAICGDNRWMHRPVIRWELLGRLSEKGSEERRIREGIRRFATVRKDSPEFAGSSPYQMMRNDNAHVFSFLRESGERKTLVLSNFSEEDQWIDAGISLRAGFSGTLLDRISAQEPVIRGKSIRIPALSCLWLSES